MSKIQEVTEPIEWDWDSLADLIDQSRANFGEFLITRKLKVGKYFLSVAACFAANCKPDRDDVLVHNTRPLRYYTHVEVAIFGADGVELAQITDGIDLGWDDGMAGYVEVAKLPILVNLMLRVSNRNTIHVPPEDRAGIIAHFDAVVKSAQVDPFEEGEYGKGGPGTHDYFSFMD